MTDAISAGSILVAESAHLPRSLQPESGAYLNGWAKVQNPRSTFEKTVQDEGWTFFFMAGEIRATVFGFDRPKALRTVLQRLIADVNSQHCNSIEIMSVVDKSFLKVPYLSVTAHPRHLQKSGMFISANGVDSDPPLVAQTQSKWS